MQSLQPVSVLYAILTETARQRQGMMTVAPKQSQCSVNRDSGGCIILTMSSQNLEDEAPKDD